MTNLQMTPRQEEHLAMIKKIAEETMDRKYRLGASEHGGSLEDMPLLEELQNALYEAIDGVVYIADAIEKYKKEHGVNFGGPAYGDDKLFNNDSTAGNK